MPETLTAGPLELRRVDPTRIDGVLEAVLASRTEIEPWMDWAHPGYSRRDAIDWAARSWQGWASGKAYEFVSVLADTGQVVGTIGLNQIAGHKGNLGFWVHTAHTGRGYCTSAARQVARAAFEHVGLARVYLRHVVGNEGSRRVAEKVGFQIEGRVRNAIVHHGAPRDMLQYSLIGVHEIDAG